MGAMKTTPHPTGTDGRPHLASTPSKAEPPTPDQVRAHRLAHGHTQAQAAELVHTNARTWQKYEAGENRMHPAMWELYRIKTAMR